MNFLNIATIFLHFTSNFSQINGARILGLFPHYAASHWKVFEPLLEKLTARGHQLVVVSPFPSNTNSNNYVHINTANMINTEGRNYIDFDRITTVGQNAWTRQKLFLSMAKEIEQCLGRREVQQVLNSTFDVALIEVFNTEIFYSLIHKLNLPAIGIVTHAINPWINSIMSNPDHASFIPSMMSTVSLPMSLLGRVQNTLEILLSKLAAKLFASIHSQKVAESILNVTLPSLTTVARNSTVLILVNTHFSLFGPAPTLPSIIEVGGLNVVPAKTLPEELQQIMDDSTDGAIYFSMGSALNTGVNDNKRLHFLRIFSELNQTVLWKDNVMAEAPPNVHYRTWFPQRDLLAHPKCKLFISHCGLLSINEAVTEAVPVVCIPIFGDQPYNAKKLQVTGMSVTLNYHDINYDTLKETIHKMLTDPMVKAKARTVSATFNDRPMSPVNTAVYWVEYVIRHQGARHLLSPARHLNWFQFYNIDVAFIIVLICWITIALIFKLITFLGKIILKFIHGSNSRNLKLKKGKVLKSAVIAQEQTNESNASPTVPLSDQLSIGNELTELRRFDGPRAK